MSEAVGLDSGEFRAYTMEMAGGGDVARTIPFQPRAIRCRVKQVRDSSGRVIATTVIRCWRPGDTARCRLCPKCDAIGDVCVVAVNFAVGAKEGLWLDTHDVPFQVGITERATSPSSGS